MFSYFGSIQNLKDLKALERREDAGREASPVGPLGTIWWLAVYEQDLERWVAGIRIPTSQVFAPDYSKVEGMYGCWRIQKLTASMPLPSEEGFKDCRTENGSSQSHDMASCVWRVGSTWDLRVRSRVSGSWRVAPMKWFILSCSGGESDDGPGQRGEKETTDGVSGGDEETTGWVSMPERERSGPHRDNVAGHDTPPCSPPCLPPPLFLASKQPQEPADG